jgi:tetratricopeptide (TPR) repeat protein
MLTMNKTEALELAQLRKTAKEFREAGRPDRAIEHLQGAGRTWTEHPAIIADLASAYAEAQEFTHADKQLEKLLAHSTTDPATLRFAAELGYSMRRVDFALQRYHALSKIDPNSLDCWLKIAEILERQGRLDDAEAAVAQALKLEPSSEEGRHLQALLAFRRGTMETACQQWCDLLTGGLRNREVLWKAGHHLAMALEKMGQYQDSIAVLQASKAGMENDFADEIKRARSAFQIKSAAIRRLTAEVTRRDLERWRAAADQDFPAVVLAGHPRSGTTLLENLLSQHREIANLEELPFLENAVFQSVYGVAAAQPGLFEVEFLNQLGNDTRSKARHIYLDCARQFSAGATDRSRVILDKNPMLTHFLTVAAGFFPRMKSIVALRDPRDVCLSCFQQPVGVLTSNVSWLRIEDTIASYQDIMGVWLKLRQITPDGWLEVRYEELAIRPAEVHRQVIEFLELPEQETALKTADQRRTIFSPTYSDAAKPVYQSSIGRWKAYEEFLAPHLPFLSSSIEAMGYE